MSEHDELTRWLARVEQKIDKLGDDHEGRLRKLERAIWVCAGLFLASGVSSLAALFGNVGG